VCAAKTKQAAALTNKTVVVGGLHGLLCLGYLGFFHDFFAVCQNSGLPWEAIYHCSFLVSF
jgi:hypothetical protein